MGSLKTNTSKSYQSKRFSLQNILTRLSDQLKEIGLNINAYDLLNFKQSTILREKYKFNTAKY